MKNFWIATACTLLVGVPTTPAAAQPILNRVEQLLRDQIDSAIKQGAAKQGQPAEPGYLGMIGDDSTSGGRGVSVVEVYPGQAAATAGLRVGDLVTRIDGREVRSMDDMAAVLGDKAPGAKLTFTVQRDAAAKDLRVTLRTRSTSGAPAVNELPAPDPLPPTSSPLPETPPPPQPSLDAPPRPRLGVRTVPVTPEVQRQHRLPDANGAHVVSVAIDSPAAKAGVPLGAVITAVDDLPVRSPEELAAAVRSADRRDVSLTYVHAGRTKKVTANIGTLILSPIGQPSPGPQLEVRARPPQPAPVDPVPPATAAPAASPPTPAPPTPALPFSEGELPDPDPNPAPSSDDKSRIEDLERRVAELEARIKALEEKQSKE